MGKSPSGSKPSDQKQDEVTGDGGDASPPTPPQAGARSIGGSSDAPSSAGGNDSSPPPPPEGSPKGGGEGGRSTKPQSARGKQKAPIGGSSATTAGSPPPPSESLEGGKAETEGHKRKRKKAALDTQEISMPCSVCQRSFTSWRALFGHMRSHKDRSWRGVFPPPISPPRQQVHQEQAEELASRLLNIGQRILTENEGTQMKGDGSAVTEGSLSSSSAEARRKKLHMELDLNKEAPEDDDGGGDSDGT